MVIFQKPNPPLLISVFSGLLYVNSDGLLQTIAAFTLIMAGIIWSYEEIRYGINLFRRFLGLLGLFAIAIFISQLMVS